jgi:hypothetical protein
VLKATTPTDVDWLESFVASARTVDDLRRCLRRYLFHHRPESVDNVEIGKGIVTEHSAFGHLPNRLLSPRAPTCTPWLATGLSRCSVAERGIFIIAHCGTRSCRQLRLYSHGTVLYYSRHHDDDCLLACRKTRGGFGILARGGAAFRSSDCQCPTAAPKLCTLTARSDNLLRVSSSHLFMYLRASASPSERHLTTFCGYSTAGREQNCLGHAGLASVRRGNLSIGARIHRFSQSCFMDTSMSNNG